MKKEKLKGAVRGKLKGKVTRRITLDKWSKDGNDILIPSEDVSELRNIAKNGYVYVETLEVIAKIDASAMITLGEFFVEAEDNKND